MPEDCSGDSSSAQEDTHFMPAKVKRNKKKIPAMVASAGFLADTFRDALEGYDAKEQLARKKSSNSEISLDKAMNNRNKAVKAKYEM